MRGPAVRIYTRNNKNHEKSRHFVTSRLHIFAQCRYTSPVLSAAFTRLDASKARTIMRIISRNILPSTCLKLYTSLKSWITKNLWQKNRSVRDRRDYEIQKSYIVYAYNFETQEQNKGQTYSGKKTKYIQLISPSGIALTKIKGRKNQICVTQTFWVVSRWSLVFL